MRQPILENITGFDTTFNRNSELTHYIKHIAYDVQGVATPEDYIALARRGGFRPRRRGRRPSPSFTSGGPVQLPLEEDR